MQTAAGGFSSLLVALAGIFALAIQAFGEAAFFFECAGECCELAIQEVAARIQEGKYGVCSEYCRWHGLTRTITD